MSKTNYTDAEFQKDLAELTNLINNYDSNDSNNDMKKKRKTQQDMEGGKKRRKSRKRSAKKSSKKRRSHKRGGDDMEGGKKRRKSAKKSGKKSSKKRRSHKRGGAKRVHKVDVDGKLLRSFRVIELNGKDVSKDPKWSQRFYHGRAKRNTSLSAGHSMYRWACKHLNKNLSSCKITFKLIETTKGSPKSGRIYGTFIGKAVKLDKPKVFKRLDKRTKKMKEIKSYYVYEVRLAKGHK